NINQLARQDVPRGVVGVGASYQVLFAWDNCQTSAFLHIPFQNRPELRGRLADAQQADRLVAFQQILGRQGGRCLGSLDIRMECSLRLKRILPGENVGWVVGDEQDLAIVANLKRDVTGIVKRQGVVGR